ncbi:MAG: 4-hydroxy-tetrahydrodipicolinate synthase [Bacillota bacterium]
MENLGRLITAMVTPFDRKLGVDYQRAAELAKYLAGNGSDGILVSGTTGESPTLSVQEKTRLLEKVLEAVGDQTLVLAGTGSNSTSDSIHLTKRAEAIGAHAVMLVAPYYNKPPQNGLYQHFREIAEATRLPVMLYNVPGRTASNILPATVARLARIANIVAIKEASGNLDQITEIRRLCPDSFQIYSGDDSATLPILAIGGVGVVSVVSHIAGKDIRRMVEAFEEGNHQEAASWHARLFPLFKALFVTTNPIPVKAALELAGFPVGGVRLPLVGPEERDVEVIRQAMAEYGLIK